jgi:uncharacterized protein YdeI (YjbR/CyaY-like superfamily)
VSPRFFETPAEWRSWLAEHHATESEVLVGFHRRASGLPCITWQESVLEALCFGWIDGVRRGLDETSYTVRFTPRKPRSIWSKVNIAHAERLIAEGRMEPAGLAAFEARTAERSGVYSFEGDGAVELPPEYAPALDADRDAAAFFAAQARWYRRAAVHWVRSAKREETRQRRLAQLVESSAAGRRVPPLAR